MEKKHIKAQLISLLKWAGFGAVIGVLIVLTKIYGIEKAQGHVAAISTFFINNGLLITLLLTILSLLALMIIRYKISKDNYSDAEDSIYEKSEFIINITLMSNVVCICLNFMFLGFYLNATNTSVSLIYTNGIPNDFNMINIIYFILILVVAGFNDYFSLKLIKKVQPEKYIKAIDPDFDTKLINSLDEGELRKQGYTALIVLRKMIFVYCILFMLGMLLHLDNSFYLAIAIIWISQNIITVYTDKKYKLSND